MKVPLPILILTLFTCAVHAVELESKVWDQCIERVKVIRAATHEIRDEIAKGESEVTGLKLLALLDVLEAHCKLKDDTKKMVPGEINKLMTMNVYFVVINEELESLVLAGLLDKKASDRAKREIVRSLKLARTSLTRMNVEVNTYLGKLCDLH